MSEVTFSIHPVEIRSLKFENAMTIRPGEELRIQMQTASNVKINPNVPTAALVMVKFEAVDETKSIQFSLETVTAVTVENPVDGFDEIIKEKYMPAIMLGVNEKVRLAALTVGLTLTPPAIKFTSQAEGNGVDAEIFKSM